MPALVDSSPAAAPDLGLEMDGRTFVARGRVVVGRSPRCDVVIDDEVVSRAHAAFERRGSALLVTDLGSRNGVMAMGQRVDGSRLLQVGERVVIGHTELQVVALCDPTRTVDDGDGAAEPDDTSFSTRHSNAFEMLQGVVEKAVALGRPDEAERLLQRHLGHLLEDARGQRPVPVAVSESGSRIAIKLSEALGKSEWIDYVFHVFGALERLMPAAIVDEIDQAVRRVPGTDTVLIRHYTQKLQLRAAEWAAADRALLDRIAGLERVALL